MIEITNKTKSPVQLIVRSRVSPRSFTTLNIPSIGRGKNIVFLEDENINGCGEYIDRMRKLGWITVRQVPNQVTIKGE